MEDNYLVHDMAKVEEMIKILDEKSVDDVVKSCLRKLSLLLVESGSEWTRLKL